MVDRRSAFYDRLSHNSIAASTYVICEVPRIVGILIVLVLLYPQLQSRGYILRNTIAKTIAYASYCGSVGIVVCLPLALYLLVQFQQRLRHGPLRLLRDRIEVVVPPFAVLQSLPCHGFLMCITETENSPCIITITEDKDNPMWRSGV